MKNLFVLVLLWAFSVSTSCSQVFKPITTVFKGVSRKVSEKIFVKAPSVASFVPMPTAIYLSGIVSKDIYMVPPTENLQSPKLVITNPKLFPRQFDASTRFFLPNQSSFVKDVVSHFSLENPSIRKMAIISQNSHFVNMFKEMMQKKSFSLPWKIDFYNTISSFANEQDKNFDLVLVNESTDPIGAVLSIRKDFPKTPLFVSFNDLSYKLNEPFEVKLGTQTKKMNYLKILATAGADGFIPEQDILVPFSLTNLYKQDRLLTSSANSIEKPYVNRFYVEQFRDFIDKYRAINSRTIYATIEDAIEIGDNSLIENLRKINQKANSWKAVIDEKSSLATYYQEEIKIIFGQTNKFIEYDKAVRKVKKMYDEVKAQYGARFYYASRNEYSRKEELLNSPDRGAIISSLNELQHKIEAIKELTKGADPFSRKKYNFGNLVTQMGDQVSEWYRLVNTYAYDSGDFVRVDKATYDVNHFFLREGPIKDLPSNIKVAILNDSPQVIKGYQIWEAKGWLPNWTLVNFSNEDEFLRVFSADNITFDLIITDLDMGTYAHSSYVVKKIREQVKDTPIVVSSALLDEDVANSYLAEDLFNAGADAYISSRALLNQLNDKSTFHSWAIRMGRLKRKGAIQ